MAQPAAASFLAPGDGLAAVCRDNSVRVWDDPSGEPRRTFTTGEPAPHHERALSPDGHLLALKEADGRVTVWNAPRGERQSVLSGAAVAIALAFVPDGRTLATGGETGLVRFWDTSTGEPSRPPLTCRSGVASALTCSPDGRTLLVAPAGEAAVRLWRVPSGRELFSLPSPVEGLRALVMPPDNRTLLGANPGTADVPSQVVSWECGSPGP